jgi:hypothetical protein
MRTYRHGQETHCGHNRTDICKVVFPNQVLVKLFHDLALIEEAIDEHWSMTEWFINPRIIFPFEMTLEEVDMRCSKSTDCVL